MEDVAHRDGGDRLRGQILLDDRLGEAAEQSQLALQPIVEARNNLTAQPTKQLDAEGSAGLTSLLGRQQGLVELDGARTIQTEQLIGEFVALLAMSSGGHQELRLPTGILDEQDTQIDGHRPEFAEGQCLAALVGGDVAGQLVGVEEAVGVRDVGPHDGEDPGMAGEGARPQFRQLAEVATGQVAMSQPGVLLQGVEVVYQPLGRRAHRSAAGGGLTQTEVALPQDAGVVPHPLKQ